jgi:hypothetical protein
VVAKIIRNDSQSAWQSNTNETTADHESFFSNALDHIGRATTHGKRCHRGAPVESQPSDVRYTAWESNSAQFTATKEGIVINRGNAAADRQSSQRSGALEGSDSDRGQFVFEGYRGQAGTVVECESS